jgi:hypothetical protein
MTHVTLVAVVVASCGTSGGGPDAGPLAIELGTGAEEGFEPIVDGQELGLVTGPQGGFHFLVHARAKGIAPGDPARPGQPDNPRTVFSAFVDDGTQEIQMDLMNPPYRLGYVTEGEWQVLPSVRILQLDLAPADVEAFYGTEVKITLRIEDSEGRVGTDERTVIARPYCDLHDCGGLPDGDAGPGDAGARADAAAASDAGP